MPTFQKNVLPPYLGGCEVSEQNTQLTWPWTWRHYAPAKHWYPFIKPRGIISQTSVSPTRFVWRTSQ